LIKIKKEIDERKMSFEDLFVKTAKYHLEHFKVMIRGEFEVKSEHIEFIHEFEVESDHINSAIENLRKKINIAVLEKSKDILDNLRRGLK